MKRKMFVILALLVFCFSLVTEAHAAVSCNGNHDWSGWQGIGATCDTAGFRERRCYRCGTVEKETLPALGHSWNGGAVTAQPSCTSGGTRVYTCTRCGATRTEGIGALGHSYGGVQVTKPSTCATMGESFQVCSRCGDRVTHVMPKNENHSWDEGVITKEPEGFTPGEKTYTCTLCGATRTEEVEPVSGIFNKLNMSLRNVPPSPGNSAANDLHIVEQPQGGSIPHGDRIVLSVAAEGGEKPYTYEWWYEPQSPQLGMGISSSALADLVYGLGQATAATIQQNRDDVKNATIVSTEGWLSKHIFSDDTTESLSGMTATEEGLLETKPFNPLAKRLSGKLPDPEVNAWWPGSYWCTVYDNAGHYVTSEKAEMREGLYIAEYPKSKNIWGIGFATLTCRAAGGSGNYSYTWYGSEGITGSALSDEATFSANQEGTYHCFVIDYETGETVDSNSVQVYSDEETQVDLRPIITLQPSNVELVYREDGKYSWDMVCQAITFDGGSQDLRYTWYGETDTGWSPITESEVLNGSWEFAVFRCTVTDTRTGQYRSSNEAYVRMELLRYIEAEEPVIDGDNMTMEFVYSGGNRPFQVSVYQHTRHMIHDGLSEPGTGYKDILVDQFTTDSVAPLIITKKASYVMAYYANGLYQSVEPAEYFVIVEDAFGMIHKSDIVRAPR